jgi:hypothetical protein
MALRALALGGYRINENALVPLTRLPFANSRRIPNGLGNNTGIDYAQLVKIYGSPETSQYNAQVRYSPAVCMGARKVKIIGKPKYEHVSTSICERNNLNMRMGMRRFTRLTNAFSKKVENHEHAIALYFMFYSFCRIHQSLRVTPAMEAKVTDHVWNLEEIVDLLGQ